jgi:hypothetical protein
MFLNKVLDKKDYISLLCAYLFGIGSGLYAYTFIIPKPEPQVIVLDKLQLQKDLKMLFKPPLSKAEREKIEKQNAIERMTRN